MAIVITHLANGSTLLVFYIIWQAKTVNPDLQEYTFSRTEARA